MATLGRRPVLAALLGACCIAFSGPLVRLADVPPASAAVFRCLLALPVLALLARREDRVLGLFGEADAADAARPLDDHQAPDRGGEAGEERVGEPLRQRGGGQGVEQAVGKRDHAGESSFLKDRTATETRWRAASGEQPRAQARSG